MLSLRVSVEVRAYSLSFPAAVFLGVKEQEQLGPADKTSCWKEQLWHNEKKAKTKSLDDVSQS